VSPDVRSLWSRQAAGGSSFYFPGKPGGEMPIVFEAGLPDPVTFPIDDLARLTAAVLARDANEMQYGTPIGGDLSYGFYGLRELLAERAADRDGRDVDPSGVMLTAGGAQAISLVAQAFLDPGDHAVVEAPSWEYPLRDFTVAGAVTTGLPLDGDGLPVDALEAHIDALESRGERLKLVYSIATFNVPTGVCLSLDRRRRLVELAAERGFVIVEDNVYGDLRYEGAPLPTLFSLDPEGVVLKIDSFSKVVMPGLRLGWVTGAPEAITALDHVRRDLGVGQLVARVMAEYVRDGLLDPHIAEVVDVYRAKRDAAVAAFESSGCGEFMTWNRPQGGYFLWLELKDGVDGRALQKRALQQGVMCRPGERFYGEPELGAQRMRFAFTAVPIDQLQRAAEVLSRAATGS